MAKLENKIAVVTGAASGMGKAIARLYAQEGAKVVVADYNFEGAEAVVKEITEANGQAISMSVNVADGDAVNKMIEDTVSEYGSLDILVNNAGVMDNFEPVGEIKDEDWDRIFDINTKGVMRAMRKAVNYWIDNDKSGVIVNTISTGGISGAHAGATYGASKHAVVGLTKNTAYMYAKKNIRVNGIAPGAVATNISSSITNPSKLGAERLQAVQGIIPKVGQPEEIAEAALFLASEDSSFINGVVLPVDGGWTSPF